MVGSFFLGKTVLLRELDTKICYAMLCYRLHYTLDCALTWISRCDVDLKQNFSGLSVATDDFHQVVHVRVLGSKGRRRQDRKVEGQAHTDTFRLCGVSNEPLVTSAAEAPHRVLTPAVLTDSWFGRTFVEI